MVGKLDELGLIVLGFTLLVESGEGSAHTSPNHSLLVQVVLDEVGEAVTSATVLEGLGFAVVVGSLQPPKKPGE